MNKLIFAGLALVVMGGAGVGGYYLQAVTNDYPEPARYTGPTYKSIIGEPRPAFRLPGLNGDMHAISHWDGDILAINFWATWCKPCKEEIPEFVELQNKYRDRGVTFIGVAIDQTQPVSDFVERYGMNYPVLIGEQAAVDAARAYGNQIGALPYTAFVDRSGRIVHVHRGRLPKTEAEAILQDLLPPAG